MAIELYSATPEPYDIASDAALLAKFAPKVWLYSDEIYFPASVEWYLLRVQMVYNQAISTQQGIIFNQIPILSTVTVNNIDTQTRHDPFFGKDVSSGFNSDTAETAQFYLPVQSPASTYFGMASGSGMEVNLNNPPVYGAVVERPELKATDLVYGFFYAYNGRALNDIGLYTHEGDWEHVIVRVDGDHERILGIYFQAHRSVDPFSKWYFPPDTDDPDSYVPDGATRFLVYAGQTSHASYTRPGTYSYGFGGDDFTDRGILWDPVNNIVVMESNAPGWINYSGFWGRAENRIIGGGPPSGPKAQGWFNSRSDGPAEHIEITVNWRKGQTSRVSDDFSLNLPNSTVDWEIAGVSPDRADRIRFNVSKNVRGGNDERVLTNIGSGFRTPGKNNHTDNLYLSSLSYTDENGKTFTGKHVFPQLGVQSFEVVIEKLPT